MGSKSKRRRRTERCAAITGKTLPAGYKLLAVHETPLMQVIARANKESVNLYAESLLKRLGAAASKQSGSWENGAAAVKAFLIRIGADEKQFRIDDGCGLSRDDAISADVMMQILQHNFYGKNRDVFIDSLAAPGQEGTLEKRFEGSPLRGRVFAKSGFINNVSTQRLHEEQG